MRNILQKKKKDKTILTESQLSRKATESPVGTHYSAPCNSPSATRGPTAHTDSQKHPAVPATASSLLSSLLAT